MILTPAYGRDYKSKAALLADFNANKDFIYNAMFNTTYINKEQIDPGTKITFRYSKHMKVFVHTV